MRYINTSVNPDEDLHDYDYLCDISRARKIAEKASTSDTKRKTTVKVRNKNVIEWKDDRPDWKTTDDRY